MGPSDQYQVREGHQLNDGVQRHGIRLHRGLRWSDRPLSGRMICHLVGIVLEQASVFWCSCWWRWRRRYRHRRFWPGVAFCTQAGWEPLVVNARRCQSFVARIRETETEGSKPFANVGCIDGGPPIEAKRVLKKSCTTRHPVSHMGVSHSRFCKYGSGTSGSAQHEQRSGGGTWAHDMAMRV